MAYFVLIGTLAVSHDKFRLYRSLRIKILKYMHYTVVVGKMAGTL
jgi:hypothetical protein